VRFNYVTDDEIFWTGSRFNTLETVANRSATQH